ncbi:cytochrome P450 [Polyangium spumosum]|nr:cytochrome P450 [Polyangium spumosum]
MTTTAPRDLRFDPMDPSYVKDPYPLFARFRKEAPVLHWELGGGPIFFRYRDVLAIMRDPRLGNDPTLGAGLHADMKAAYPDFAAQVEHSLFYAEGAWHARIRKLVNPAFGPRAIEAHRPKVKAIIDALLDELPREGEINVSADFNRKFPVQVISSILNIPPHHQGDFIAYSDALIATALPGLPPELFASYMPAFSRGCAIVRECIAARRAEPIEDDLLSQLVAACDEGDRLSDAELVALVGALLAGGTDTTVHGTNNTMLSLLRNPAQYALLRENPGLARSAFEEALRLEGIQRVPLVRYAKEPLSLEGIHIERGKPVFFALLSALRDPEYLADADVYDIRRQVPGTTLWFGHGAHFCLGASLARMEAEIALQAFFERYPKVELAGEPVYGSQPILRNIDNLPLRVSASA